MKPVLTRASWVLPKPANAAEKPSSEKAFDRTGS